MKNSNSEKSNTGYKGIFFEKKRGLFVAQVSNRSIRFGEIVKIYIGSYATLKEAIEARENYIKSLF